MNKEDAKVINIGDSSPINISLVDNTPIPVVVDVIKNEPQPIEVYSNTSIISGAANLYELGDVASDGHQVLDSGDKKVLMLNADDKHPGKWMAGKVNLSEYAKKTELDEISNNIENTNKDLSGVKEDLLEKEAFLDEKIAEIKGNLEKTKDELIFTQKELVDAKNELSDARQRLEEQGMTVEMVVGQVNEQEQKITTAITNIESESDRVNILRSEMDGINLTITNEILSQLNEDGSDITLKIGQKIDARAETIETAVKKLREGTDETMVSWVGQKIDGRAETIETAIKKLQTGEDAELVSWVGQKIDGRAETIETAVSKLREGTDETMVSWVGQKIDAKAETITTAVIESLEEEGFATKEFVGQEIDGAKKSVTTGIMTFITEQDFSTKSFVGQEIDGAEGRITTAYEKYVEDKGYATTTFVGQEIDGVNKTITTAVAESKESIVGEDGVINSRIQAAYTSWDITGIKNSVVDQNGNYIKSSEINQKADNILITVQENDEGYKGRFSSIEANLDGVSTIIANGDNYAAIIARVNEDSSSVTIEAKKINLLGETVARELSAIKATINELTLTNAHVSGVVECVINDTVYWQLLNDGSGTLAKGNIKWNPDGSGSLASGNINWDINGNAVFNGSIESGSGKIAGWTISADCISSNREGANTKLFSNGHLVNEETDENGKLWKHWEFNYDGSGSIANNSLSWDPYGYIKLGDDVILGANELRVAQLISNVSLLLSMFELDENGDIKTKDYYADGAWHSRGLYSPSFISSGGKSNTPSTGGGTVIGIRVDADTILGPTNGIVDMSDVLANIDVDLSNYYTKQETTSEIAKAVNDLNLGQYAKALELDTHIGNSTIHITAEERTAWDNKYDKPASGIPYADLADGVKLALDKAHEHANKTSVLDKLKWNEDKNAIYIGDENNRINFFVYGGVASGGFSDAGGTGGGTVIGATVGGESVKLSNGILEFDAYPTTTSLGLKNLAFKDSLAVSEIVGLQSALSNKQDAATAITTSNIGSQSVNYATSAGNADTLDSYHKDNIYGWKGVSDLNGMSDAFAGIKYFAYGFAEAPSIANQPNGNYANDARGVLCFDGIYCPLQLSWEYEGRNIWMRTKYNDSWNNWYKLAFSSDIPTNNNQLINGAGYITSSGSCAYATSAGNADTLDGQHSSYFAAESSLSNYLPLSGGTITGLLTITTHRDTSLILDEPTGEKYHVISFRANGKEYANLSANYLGSENLLTFNDSTIYHSGNSNNTSTLWSASSLNIPIGGKIFNGGNYGLYVNGSADDYGSAIYLTHDHGQNQTAFRIHSHYSSEIGALSFGFSTTSQSYGASPVNATYNEIITVRGISGNVGIGTTSPSEKFHVHGNILASGAITAGTASDSRLKSNIATLCNASSVLRQLRGVGFDWNALATDKSSYFKGHDVGLIAQEVEPLIPSAIGTIWGEYKRLDYSKITPYLVEGWKEHDDEIHRLKAEIIELKKKIYGLEK